MSPIDNEFDVTEVVVKTPAPKKAKKNLVLKNVSDKEMNPDDYFYSETEEKAKIPESFNDVCGMPVMREDLVEVFNEVFNPKDNILFYKPLDKEVYIIIIPLKYSTSVGKTHESVNGDFQKHAISFIGEGSVNIDTMRSKLKRILNFVNFVAR